jgi:trigger factor
MPYEWTAPDEAAVEAAFEELRQMYATTENVEREATEGDYVLVDVKSETPEINRTGFAAYIRKEPRDLEWPYNGFAKELIGLKAGDVKAIKHTFAEDHDLAELQGKEVEMEVTVKTVRAVSLPELDDEFAKMTGAGETVDALREAVKADVENRARAEYEDKFFIELLEKIKEGATLKYHEHALEHEGEHVLEDLSQRLAQQGMDLDTYFKVRNTTREQFIDEEVKPVARKRLERSLILDEVVRREQLQVENEELDAEFNQTLNALSMQGLDFGKIRGGRQGQQRVAQAVAMESANRVLTRRALEILKSIAVGEYKSPEERAAEAAALEASTETVEAEQPAEADQASSAPEAGRPTSQESETPESEAESSSAE